MAKKEQSIVVAKKPIYGKRTTKSGKRVRGGTEITVADADGVASKKVLLTPAGKGAKYADELKNNRRITNEGQPKTNSCGCVQELTPEQRAFRGGYLQAQKDSAKCYKAKKQTQRKRGQITAVKPYPAKKKGGKK